MSQDIVGVIRETIREELHEAQRADYYRLAASARGFVLQALVDALAQNEGVQRDLGEVVADARLATSNDPVALASVGAKYGMPNMM